MKVINPSLYDTQVQKVQVMKSDSILCVFCFLLEELAGISKMELPSLSRTYLFSVLCINNPCYENSSLRGFCSSLKYTSVKI